MSSIVMPFLIFLIIGGLSYSLHLSRQAQARRELCNVFDYGEQDGSLKNVLAKYYDSPRNQQLAFREVLLHTNTPQNICRHYREHLMQGQGSSRALVEAIRTHVDNFPEDAAYLVQGVVNR